MNSFLTALVEMQHNFVSRTLDSRRLHFAKFSEISDSLWTMLRWTYESCFSSCGIFIYNRDTALTLQFTFFIACQD